jgi:hypothetical protein
VSTCCYIPKESIDSFMNKMVHKVLFVEYEVLHCENIKFGWIPRRWEQNTINYKIQTAIQNATLTKTA